MGRQLNQIIEGLSGVTAGTSTINVNLDAIEALLTTLQADVADGIIVSSGTANTNLRDGAGNAIESTSIGGKRRLDVNLSSAGTTGSSTPSTANLYAGTDGTNLRAVSVDASGRLNTNTLDGLGNAITSTVSGSSRRLDVMLSSGGATGSAAPANANLVGGTDGTNLRGLSVDSSGRLNINGSLFTDGSLTYTNTGAITAGSVVIASTDVTNYREASIQIVSLGSGGGGIIPQISNDNSNWVASSAQNATGTSTASTLTSTTSIFKVNFQAARYFRIVTNGTISSGTTTIVVYLSSQATPISTQLVNVSGGVTIQPSASFGHATTHTNISASGTNATLVRSSSINVAFIHAVNTSSLARYLKLYNLGVSPTVGTSNPFFNYLIPPASALNIDFGFAGLRLTTGLAYAITGGQALLDTTSVNAGDVVINIATV